MLNKVLFYFSFVALIFLYGCTSVTMNQLKRAGKKPLTSAQLEELITTNGLHLEASNFDAKVQFSSNGQLTAKSRQGDSTKGKWTITPEDQLCFKFKLWYYGDVRCYTVFNGEKNSYLFFTSNGARYYKGRTMTSKISTYQPSSSPRKTTQPTIPVSPKATKIEEQESLHRLARNCPGCNFSGADLKDAQLIGADLSGANLKGADLSDANLRRANLTGANLSRAKLTRTNLSGADLSNCDLSNSDLSGSNLIRANITDANIDGALFNGAHLESIQGMKK